MGALPWPATMFSGFGAYAACVIKPGILFVCAGGRATTAPGAHARRGGRCCMLCLVARKATHGRGCCMLCCVARKAARGRGCCSRVLRNPHLVHSRTQGPPLLHAAAWGEADMVELLLSAGAEVGTRDIAGHTALHYACSGGHAAAAEALLRRGADVRCVRKGGKKEGGGLEAKWWRRRGWSGDRGG